MDRRAENGCSGGTVEIRFTQTMTVRCSDRARLIELAEAWDIQQANADIMGYMGGRVLADRQDPGRYVIVADFAVIDPDVPAADEADRNNERPETQASSARLREILDADIEFHDYDEIYRTDR
jgi:hypothetical protein